MQITLLSRDLNSKKEKFNKWHRSRARILFTFKIRSKKKSQICNNITIINQNKFIVLNICVFGCVRNFLSRDFFKLNNNNNQWIVTNENEQTKKKLINFCWKQTWNHFACLNAASACRQGSRGSRSSEFWTVCSDAVVFVFKSILWELNSNRVFDHYK